MKTVLHLSTNNCSRKRFTATRHDCSVDKCHIQDFKQCFQSIRVHLQHTTSWNSSSRHSCACAGLSWLNQRS